MLHWTLRTGYDWRPQSLIPEAFEKTRCSDVIDSLVASVFQEKVVEYSLEWV